MKLRWTQDAIRDLVKLRDDIAQERPQVAATVAQRILRAIQRLEAFPEMGRPGRAPGTRELIVPQTPYIVPYRLRDERIELLRVFHGARRWPEKI